ncbi:hypothetical protein [Halpernia frigidisoli]|uniref:GTP-binding protein n=1 Tax=Halpernia frigidisoli TaxID=1125876 RepID=A0A1I3F936_9FLAO|nr:hypothetical protein [Halpernia frigidisoli]SFI07650.1 hypothetical protein SAMN05443292_1223 [Halpernia frigidisoli]
MEQSTFDQIRTRPRFKLYTVVEKSDYTVHLRDFLKAHESEFEGNINRETALINVKSKYYEYWKPYVALRTEFDQEENSTCIRGVFGPSSAVWTFFMFLFFFLGIGWMLCITLFYVAKQIKHDGFGWAFPTSMIFLGLIFLVYIAGRIGRKKGKEEMEKLRNFVVESTLHLESKSTTSEL